MGQIGKRKLNGDFWRISINEKGSILNFLNLIESNLKHEKRICDLKKARNNILERNKKPNKETK